MTNRRSTLSLAAVLAATVLTGGAAILGITHTPAPVSAQAASATVVQPAQTSQQSWEEAD